MDSLRLQCDTSKLDRSKDVDRLVHGSSDSHGFPVELPQFTLTFF